MATPSETAMVVNSRGVPPEAAMPSLACAACAARPIVQGVTSDSVETTPMNGFAIAASSSPMPRMKARCGVRSSPSVVMRERSCCSFMLLSVAASRVLAQQVDAADIAPGEAGTYRRPGADRLGADRVGHGDAGAIEAADDAAVLAQHLAALVGARAALGGEDAAMIGSGVEGRLLDRAERAVAVWPRCVFGIEHFPCCLAAPEIVVPAGAGETVEAGDRGGERCRVEIDQPGERFEAVGLAEPARIAPPEPHRQPVAGGI